MEIYEELREYSNNYLVKQEQKNSWNIRERIQNEAMLIPCGSKVTFKAIFTNINDIYFNGNT